MQKWYIGCSGFYYLEWKGKFYPEKMPNTKWFECYAHQFNTLELNNTFYRFPELKTLNSWYNRSPSDFIFSVKAPRSITHYNKFSDSQELISEFYEVINGGLKEKLGCVLFQLPPNLHLNEEKLELIIKNLNPDFKNVIEFRHVGWWNDTVSQKLSRHNIIFCGINHPTLPNDVMQNTETLYYRFHGAPELYKSEYSEDTIKKFAEQILKSESVKEVYVYFNNTANLAAIKNAKQLIEIVNKTKVYEIS
jgi:uncharacterized protein YecE (DUF72 family)